MILSILSLILDDRKQKWVSASQKCSVIYFILSLLLKFDVGVEDLWRMDLENIMSVQELLMFWNSIFCHDFQF